MDNSRDNMPAEHKRSTGATTGAPRPTHKRVDMDQISPHASISIKLGLVFALILIAVVINFLTIQSFQAEQETDGAAIDASGRNRMLSQRIGFYAEQAIDGKPGAKEALREIIDLHHISFYALKDGGVAPNIAGDRILPPATPRILSTILHAEQLWFEYKRNAEIIVNEPIFIEEAVNPTVRAAMDFIEENGPEQLRRNNEIVNAYVQLNDEKRMRINAVLWVLMFANIIIIGIGALIVRSIIAPIHHISSVAQRIIAGNLRARAKVRSRDEIGLLSQNINEMANTLVKTNVSLEEKVKTRTRELEEMKKGLEEEVVRRTDETQNRVLELERFNEMAVGRELKMLELKSELEKYKVLADTSQDCIKMLDIDGNLSYMNKEGLREHGFKSLEEALSKHWKAVETIVPKDQHKFTEALKNAAKGKASVIEIEHTKEGSTREVCSEIIAPIKNIEGKITGVLGVSRDITSLMKIEKELSKKVEALEKLQKQKEVH